MVKTHVLLNRIFISWLWILGGIGLYGSIYHPIIVLHDAHLAKNALTLVQENMKEIDPTGDVDSEIKKIEENLNSWKWTIRDAGLEGNGDDFETIGSESQASDRDPSCKCPTRRVSQQNHERFCALCAKIVEAGFEISKNRYDNTNSVTLKNTWGFKVYSDTSFLWWGTARHLIEFAGLILFSILLRKWLLWLASPA